MRNTLLAAVTLLLTAACGAYVFPGGTTTSDGTVTGNVIAVPCAPVESSLNPCNGKPVGAIELDFANGDTTRATVTDAKGDYSIDLAPGTWKVRVKSYMRIVKGMTTITVAAGSKVVADYVLDTGIRVPAPQP